MILCFAGRNEAKRVKNFTATKKIAIDYLKSLQYYQNVE